jgi:uncharacterized protein YdaU (DUF1376 family)
MAFKPNYNQKRAERNRLLQAKKEAKQREREEAVARRKADSHPAGQEHQAGQDAAPGAADERGA